MAFQTSYDRTPGKPFSGTPGDTGPKRDGSYLNTEGSDIPAGIAVTLKSEGEIELFDASTDTIAGIVLNTFARDPNDLTGSAAVKDDDMCNVRELGAVYVAVEETVTVGEPVYCRHTSDGGSNTQLGKFRNDSDSGRARLVAGARWLQGGTTTSPALLHFNADVESGVASSAAVADLTMGTNVTAATANGSLEDSSATNPTEAQFNNNMKELGTKINAILAALRLAGIVVE